MTLAAFELFASRPAPPFSDAVQASRFSSSLPLVTNPQIHPQRLLFAVVLLAVVIESPGDVVPAKKPAMLFRSRWERSIDVCVRPAVFAIWIPYVQDVTVVPFTLSWELEPTAVVAILIPLPKPLMKQFSTRSVPIELTVTPLPEPPFNVRPRRVTTSY